MTLAGIGLLVASLAVVPLLASPGTLGLVLATLAVAVVGFACLTPSLQALISRRTSVDRQGEILGVNQAAAAIARILGPFLGNVLYGDRTANHALPYYAGALLLCCSPSCWRWHSGKSRCDLSERGNAAIIRRWRAWYEAA